jgi:hypothetical protein
VYQSAQPQIMSPHGTMQPIMSMLVQSNTPTIVMQPMEQSWSENAQLECPELDIPVVEAQALTPPNGEPPFPGAGDVLNSMPQMPVATKLMTTREPPPPPPGAPKVFGMTQPAPMMMSNVPVGQARGDLRCIQQAPEAQRPAQLTLPGSMHYHQQPMQPASPTGVMSPVGYMTCGSTQYALVPVPVEQTYPGSPVHAMSSPNSPHDSVTFTPYHEAPYPAEQHWSHCASYQCMPEAVPVSPIAVGMTMGNAQFW